MKFSILAIGELKPDFISSRIQKFLKTNYSHIAICVDDEDVFHATGKGFHQEKLKDVMPGHHCPHSFDFYLKKEQAAYALGWLQGAKGTEYSQSQYIGFIFPWLKKFFKNGRKKTVCSEIAFDFATECLNIQKPSWIDSDFVSPKDIVLLLQYYFKSKESKK